MKIIVDKMPETTEECIFGQNGPVFAGKRYCDLSDGKYCCCNTEECPYLQPLAREVTWTSNVNLIGDPDTIKKAIEEAVNMALKRRRTINEC